MEKPISKSNVEGRILSKKRSFFATSHSAASCCDDTLNLISLAIFKLVYLPTSLKKETLNANSRKIKNHYTNKVIFILFHAIAFVGYAQTPPYSGTIFIDPDIITSADPSLIQSTNYTGQGLRTVYDRRVNNWVTINAHLFNVVWSDGLTSEAVINPEFTLTEATFEAEKYAHILGQLPNCLRVNIDQIWVHKGVNPFGGGNNSVLIHTGQSVLYENDGILEETLVHEAAHTSLDAAHSAATGWTNAQIADGNFISTYAQNNPTTEDIAETFLLWLAVRHRAAQLSLADYNTITQTVPNRLLYFDNQNFNLNPFCNALAANAVVGNSSVCNNSLQTYSIAPILGSTYNWTVTSGNIVSGQGTNQITVQWGNGTTGTVNVVQTPP